MLASALLAAELGVRVALAVRGEPYSAAGTRDAVEALLQAQREFVPRGAMTREEQAARRFAEKLREHGRELDAEGERKLLRNVPRLHPYVGFLTQQAHDSHEHMLRAYPKLREHGRAVVFVLGGSAAAIFAEEGADRWIELLNGDPRIAERDLVVFTLAQGGHKQPQQVHALSYFLSLGIVPDVVLLLDGYNEVGVGLESLRRGSHGAYPSFQHYAHVAGAAGGSPESVDLVTDVRLAQRELERLGELLRTTGGQRLAVVGYPTLARMSRLRGEIVDGYREYAGLLQEQDESHRFSRGPRYPRPQDAPVEECVRVWADGARQVAALCEAYGSVFVHVLQPTLADEGSKPRSPEERELIGPDSWDEGARVGYPLLRAAGAQIAVAGHPFLDASRLFRDVEETLYFDYCHFGARGNRILAEWLAERTREAIAGRLELARADRAAAASR